MRGDDVVVVKLGGTTVAEQRHALEDVAALARTERVVVVHGGGVLLTEWLARLGVESRFEQGLRVTDDATIQVALAVLGGIVNTELVAALREFGANAIGVTGVEVLLGERIPSLGRVARVVGVNSAALDALFAAGFVPVVAPLVRDRDGVVCNVNADDAAAGIAAAIHASELVLLTDVDGVRDGDGQRVETLDERGVTALIDRGVIAGGMVPKVRACLGAVTAGTREAVIADGSAERPVQRALHDVSFGTRVRA